MLRASGVIPLLTLFHAAFAAPQSNVNILDFTVPAPPAKGQQPTDPNDIVLWVKVGSHTFESVVYGKNSSFVGIPSGITKVVVGRTAGTQKEYVRTTVQFDEGKTYSLVLLGFLDLKAVSWPSFYLVRAGGARAGGRTDGRAGGRAGGRTGGRADGREGGQAVGWISRAHVRTLARSLPHTCGMHSTTRHAWHGTARTHRPAPHGTTMHGMALAPAPAPPTPSVHCAHALHGGVQPCIVYHARIQNRHAYGHVHKHVYRSRCCTAACFPRRNMDCSGCCTPHPARRRCRSKPEAAASFGPECAPPVRIRCCQSLESSSQPKSESVFNSCSSQPRS